MIEFCIDFEIAKELKENGFPHESFCAYDINGNFWHNCLEEFPAPTSDELLKELNKYKSFLHMQSAHEFRVHYDHPIYNGFEDKKLSNALAKMWLYLKKEGYIK